MDFAHAWLDAEAQAGTHVVQFYEDDAFLADVVGRYSGDALLQGNSLVWIATAEHLESFGAALSRCRPSAETAGLLLQVDARQLLSTFMVDGRPDPVRFQTAVRPLLEQASERGPISAYGEMVDLLWAEGNSTAAIALEHLWNGLAKEWEFRLLCAYAMRNFPAGADGDGFLEVCTAHTHVVPTEEFSRLQTEEHRRREISQLQQRAQALEHEIERRKGVEARLTEALRLRDDFVAIAGHELRTPLTALGLLIQRLERTAASRNDPELSQQVSRTRRQATRLTGLAEQLLDVSRLSGEKIPLHRERFELGSLVNEVVARFADGGARARCQVTLFAPEPISGSWDRLRLEQVVTNLLANALKYGAGQPVALSVTRGLADSVLLSVTDHGIGIDPAAQARIFQRFERAVSADHFGGLGLGLWITHQLVEAHGGSIRVQSQPGAGATFTVALPLA